MVLAAALSMARGELEMQPKMESENPGRYSFTLVMLAMLVTAPALGAIDALRAYRNQDLSSTFTAVGIYIVAAPLIALWLLHQHPVSRD
jgi:hypothetical protein